ncbi:MAG: DUF615 domain-containing protein [Xanthomonadales bacterium]|nr:DUF615 domain-containing protein [Xanthomonadales bacterium]NIN59402.1 DUF615 domain-containing protein [Xanthomonadales bacterium]NIN74753.1 DUF615 domain-containing protein [Xanthomonadales bacterium]NIO14889.1 DUF615 domain-containing protein [Xanthomonadales bacterium]NIP11795.1 DUF615 domain-containing protein [Xanthomonadales bacterium]
MTEQRREHATAIPSKSQRKREALALLDLARNLTDLEAGALLRLPLDEDLRTAIDQARSIRSNVARKRAVHYLAKLLRQRDAGPVLEALERLRTEARGLAAAHHRVEAWRDELIADGDAAVQRLVEAQYHAHAQTLRQLTRNARREARLGLPAAAARKLFRALRAIDDESPLPPVGGK